MSKNVMAVEADTEIEDALGLLLAEKFGCLPVVEKKKLVGILTDTDLLEYLQRLLRAGQSSHKKAQ